MARILIVDDNETLREGAAAIVRKMGHEAVICKSGADGIAAYKKFVSQTGETLRRKPSEYWARQCWVGATGAASTRADFELRHAIGVDKMMWGSDYPHPEGTWPHTGEQLRETFSGVPEDQLRPLLGENAARVYNFDVPRLKAVAERVGPAVGELAAA